MNPYTAEKPQLAIVLPCYNEARNISQILCRFAEVRSDKCVELVLVNNGSTDDSAEVLARELARAVNPAVQVVTVPANRGYGHGILCGLRAAQGEFLAWTHADLQTDLNDVIAGFALLQSAPAPQNTLLRGRRVGRSSFDVFFTWGMGIIATFALGVPLRDVNAQPKLFHRSLLARMEHAPDDFSLDLYVLVLTQRLGWNQIEFPVHFGRRFHGEAKGGGSLKGKIRLVRRTWQYIFKLRRDIRAARR